MTDNAFIVLRYERLARIALAGMERHGRRQGGDLDHVDRSRSHLNEILVGSENLVSDVNARLVEMMRDNAERRIAKLRRSRHTGPANDLADALEAAGDDLGMLEELIGLPWDAKQTMPYTEGLLSISHEWFDGDAGAWDETKVDQFRAFVIEYLGETFGSDLVYARMDMDERTPHVHFVVLPEHEEGRTGKRMLSHHKHRCFGRKELAAAIFDDEAPDPKKVRRSYEILQDEVAAFAKARGLGVERGAKRAERNRMLEDLGEAVERRDHITPAEGRKHSKRLQAEADEARSAANADRSKARKDRNVAGEERAVAARDRADAEQERAMAAEDADAVSAMRDGMITGIDAVLDERLMHDPKAGADELGWGRRKPKDPSIRDRLLGAIAPARDVVAMVAKRLAAVIRRERAADEREADLDAREDAMEREAAEQRRRADLLARADERAGRSVEPWMAAIRGDEPLPKDEASFSGAWAIHTGAKRENVHKRLDAMDNRRLRQTWSATQDAFAILAEDGPSDLLSAFDRGLQVCEADAALRGYDLEAGLHDPSCATSPSRAMLHTDQDTVPIRVVRLDRQRQRLRGG